MPTDPPKCPKCQRTDRLVLRKFENVYEERHQLGAGEPEQVPLVQVLTWRCQNCWNDFEQRIDTSD